MCGRRKEIQPSPFLRKKFQRAYQTRIVWNVQNFNQQAINFIEKRSQKDYYCFTDLFRSISCLAHFMCSRFFSTFHFYFYLPHQIGDRWLRKEISSIRCKALDHVKNNTTSWISAQPRAKLKETYTNRRFLYLLVLQPYNLLFWNPCIWCINSVGLYWYWPSWT